MHYNDNEDLGNNFYFVRDGNFSSIMRSADGKYKGTTGYEIIPPLVVDYNFNDSYIIAKTKGKKQSVKYWILDKAQHKREIPLEPLDSVNFYNKLLKENISLTFKK